MKAKEIENAIKLLEDRCKYTKEKQAFEDGGYVMLDIMKPYINKLEEKDKEIERLNNIITELSNMFYERFRINQNGFYSITDTDYKDIETKLKEGTTNEETL